MITLEAWAHGRLLAEIRLQGIDSDAQDKLTPEEWAEIAKKAGIPPPTPEFIASQRRHRDPPAR